MRFSLPSLGLVAIVATLAAAEQEVITTTAEDKNPWSNPIYGIPYANENIQALIDDLAHQNISEAIMDYIGTRIFVAEALGDKILDDNGCRGRRGFKIGPYPNTTTEAIQILQRTQVGLNVVLQDLVNKASQTDKTNDFCDGVLAPFWAVSCLETGGFAKTVNGTFAPPARWICKGLRYNGTSAGAGEVGGKVGMAEELSVGHAKLNL